MPPAVIEELVALPGEPGSGLPAEGWVERQAPKAETLRKVEGEMTEGRGEKEAIGLAREGRFREVPRRLLPNIVHPDRLDD